MMAGILLTMVALVMGLFFFAGTSAKGFDLDGIATVELPKDWVQYGAERRTGWAAFEFYKAQSWWWGAGNPHEVDAWVIVGAPEAAVAEVEDGMAWGFAALQSKSQRFPEFGSYKQGERETWVSEGSYQISTAHDPQKVIFVRSVDRGQKVGFVARVYTKKIPHEKLKELQDKMYGSVSFSGKRGTYFGEVGNWSAVAAGRRAKEIAYVNAVLAKRGVGPVGAQDEVQAKAGWVYELWDDRLMIGRRLGERVMDSPAYEARGELTWLRWRGEKWEPWKASNATAAPGRKADYFPSSLMPATWAKVLGEAPDKSKFYFFTSIDCPLTEGDKWVPELDPTGWKLEAWMENALRVEQEFKAGKLKIE
ncbi:MAG: hypothetical protein NTV52_28035 [Acidobacteria bacterium]|nr:hypothetical protein [Acidobacteriota bacterium]